MRKYKTYANFSFNINDYIRFYCDEYKINNPCDAK